MITIALVIVTLLLVAVFAVYTQTTIFAKPTGIYQTSIVAKEEKQTVIYTGAFIPMKLYYVKTRENREIQVDRVQYNRLSIGETVTIASYNNGLHKLQG